MVSPFFFEVLCFVCVSFPTAFSMLLVLSGSVESLRGPDLRAFSVLFGSSNGGEEDHKSQAFRDTSPGFNSATKARLRKQAMPGYAMLSQDDSKMSHK